MIFPHTFSPKLMPYTCLPLPGALSSGIISLPDLLWMKPNPKEIWEQDYIRPLIPKFDQDQPSPDRISTFSNKRVLRLKRISNFYVNATPNSSNLKETYHIQYRELIFRPWYMGTYFAIVTPITSSLCKCSHLYFHLSYVMLVIMNFCYG